MSTRFSRQENRAGILFALPAIAGFVLFVAGPMIASLVFSLTEYTGFNRPEFVGFSNFRRLFSGDDPYFFKSLTVTGYYVLLSVPTGLVFALAIALALNTNIKGRSFFRTMFYLPSIVPVIATSSIFIWMFNPDFGLLNSVLESLGIPGLLWIYDRRTAVPSLALMHLWTIGGPVVIFLAGLNSIPRQYYEALEIDGGRARHWLFNITLPLLTPTIFFNLIMALITQFQTFTQAYVMTDGGPNNATLFYSLYLYREAFEFSRMGAASALAWILFIIIAVLSIFVFRSSVSWVHYEGKNR